MLTGPRGADCAGLACHKVHEPAELRRETAVSLHLLPRDYKFKLCIEFTSLGTCKDGVLCFNAHGVHNLRCVLRQPSSLRLRALT